jgi:hypothetical protein
MKTMVRWLIVAHVLAVTEKAAVRQGTAASGPAEFYWSTFQWEWLIAGLLILLLLVAASRRTESFVSSVETLLNNTFAGGEKALKSWLWACAGWLKRAGESLTANQAGGGQPNSSHQPNSPQASDNPLLMLLGLVCLVIACAAAYGDYFILEQSLVIFWPISETAWVIAANMVALKVLVGICLHLFRGKRCKLVRAHLYGLLILLLVCEFTVAYMRVIEIEAATKVEQMAALVGDEQGSLIISDPEAVESNPLPAPAESQQSHGAPSSGASQKNYLSVYAILSGLITIACALSETIGISATVRYAGVALVWLPASPLLCVLTLAYCALRFLNGSGIVGLIKVSLTSIIDALSMLCALAVGVVKVALRAAKWAAVWLRRHAFRLADSYRDWQKLSRQHRSEMKVLKSELTAKERDAEAHWQQHARLTGKWHRAVEEVFDDLLTTLKGSLRLVYEQLASDVAEIAGEKTRKKAEPLTEHISSAVAEVYLKTGSALPTIDGYKANQPLPRRD